MSALEPSSRRRAFEALAPIAAEIDAVLRHVDEVVEDDRKLNQPLRSSFHLAQRAALSGTTRFSATVLGLGQALDGRLDCQRISTPTQESQNIYMWLISGHLVLRVKHDLEGVVDPGTAQLFATDADTDICPTVYLTWDIAADGSVRNVVFATVEQPTWTIPLLQLLAATAAPTQLPVPTARPAGPAVRSKRPAAVEQDRQRG
jgi:hypothetical protein